MAPRESNLLIGYTQRRLQRAEAESTSQWVDQAIWYQVEPFSRSGAYMGEVEGQLTPAAHSNVGEWVEG